MPTSATGSRKTLKRAAEPRLGIFWLVAGRLLIDSAPLCECEKYGDHLNYAGSHIDLWAKWLRIGEAPAESEYEEFPRGRVIYSAQSRFTILADTCILKRKALVATIKNELDLPKNTTLGRDSHYRCSTCLYGAHDDE